MNTEHSIVRSIATGISLLLLTGCALGGRHSESARIEPGFHRGQLMVDTLARTYSAYVPANADRQSAIVLVLHGGSGGTGARVRGFIGGELESLADSIGFLVVYPDGIGGSWNDCRAGAGYPAKLARVDDVRFLHELVVHVAGTYGGRSDGFVAIGYSNGAHLAFRLALEAPGALHGIATFGANLPEADALACSVRGLPIRTMMVNGTADPINPYAGGEVRLPDGTSLGRVRSAGESLRYLGALAGHTGIPEPVPLPSALADPTLQVRGEGWTAAGQPRIVLYTIEGGGHVIPSPHAQFPAFVGPMVRRFSGIRAAVWFLGLE